MKLLRHPFLLFVLACASCWAAYELGKMPAERGQSSLEKSPRTLTTAIAIRRIASDRDRTESLRREWENCVTAADFRAALDQLQFEADKTEENRLLSDFFQHWLEVSPIDALAEIRRIESLRHDIVRCSVVFEKWAIEQPAAALALLREVLDGRQNMASEQPPFLDGVDPPEYLLSLFSGLAKVDPQGTARLFTEAEASPIFPNALDVLLQNWFPENPAEVYQWAQSLDESPFQKEVISRAATKAGQLDDLSGGIAWAQSLATEESREIALSSLTSQWAQRHSRQAFQWVSQLPNSELKFALAPSVVAALTKIDPGAAADWLNQYEASLQMDPSIAAYALSLSSVNPAAAVGSAAAISDPAERSRITLKIEKEWALRAPESYEQYRQSAEGP
jgi:hypothetical protein